MTYISLVEYFDKSSDDERKKEIAWMTKWLNQNAGIQNVDWQWNWDWKHSGAWHSYPTSLAINDDQNAVMFRLTFGL